MAGGYLRTNFRRAGGDPLTAFGGGYLKSSFYGGAGFESPAYGGFIMGSMSGNQALIQVSAQGAMSHWFGSWAWVTAGYRIAPVWADLTRCNGSQANNCHPWLTMSIAGDSMFAVYAGFSQSVGAYLTSSFSYHLIWAGFIVSTP